MNSTILRNISPYLREVVRWIEREKISEKEYPGVDRLLIKSELKKCIREDKLQYGSEEQYCLNNSESHFLITAYYCDH